jgi:uncharacterized membrane protein
MMRGPRNSRQAKMTNRATLRRQRKTRDSIKTVDAGRTVIERPLVLLVLGGLLVAGVITRIHLLDRSLWLDEAWVANSIRAPNLHQAIYYDDWLQTTPPLFIVLSRLVTAVFGTSNAAFRALPALSGIVSVLLFSFIALKLLKPSFAMIAILLFVFSPRVILYSQSLKQYSTDVLSTISLLVLGYLYIERRADRWFYLLLAAVVALSFLSYPAMLFLPFLLYAAVTKVDSQGANDTQRSIRPKWLRLFLVIVLAVLVSVTNYLFFIAPNKTSALTDFFPEGFYQGRSLAEFLEFYGVRLLTLTGLFFFGGSSVLRIVTLCITVLGFIHLWMSQTKWPRLETFQTSVLLTAPIAGIVGLNLLGFYPLPGFDHRILLFVFPITILVFSLGLQFLVNLASGFMASRSANIKGVSLENTLGVAVFVGLIGFVWLFFNTVGLRPFFAEEHEDNEGAIAYLTQRVQANDVLYIYAAMREQFKLYAGELPVASSRVFYGRAGTPCCPRKDYRSPQRESASDVMSEVSTLSDAAAGRFLWLLVTDRPLHWVHLQRNDIEILERALAKEGCEKAEERKFTGVYIGRFRCKPK